MPWKTRRWCETESQTEITVCIQTLCLDYTWCCSCNETWTTQFSTEEEEGCRMCSCRYIMCSTAIKCSTRRGKVVTMETSFVWKAHAVRCVCPSAHWSGSAKRHGPWRGDLVEKESSTAVGCSGAGSAEAMVDTTGSSLAPGGWCCDVNL